ncbi:MAG: amidohydrolase family protein [Treponema sp.]|nr:amidohydrolase family protein [Treponema sp.]
MTEKNFVLKGDLCWSDESRSIQTISDGYLVCIDGKSAGVFPSLPECYAGLRLVDYSPYLIIPGLVDLHIHAPQFAFRGLGMDLQLLDWLERRAFPEEGKYANLEYTRKAYGLFVEHIRRGPSTRLVIYATVHSEATLLLMEMLEKSGLVTMVGKINMDRNSPDYLREESAALSLAATEKWLKGCNFKNTFPILTPRFIPSCSDELMRGLAGIQKKFGLPVQSHLSENQQEVEWVGKLCPQSAGYGAAYRDYDLFGGSVPTIMAHCVWSDKEEIALMAERQVFLAHCPQSNTNLSSGIAPVRRFLDAGVPAGLGSDIAGGVHDSIFRTMADTVQVSKLRQTLLKTAEKPIKLEEAFYLGTAGGGSFFGKCGSFTAGNDFDVLVMDDRNLAAPFELSIQDRLDRVVYLSDERNIRAKYVKGNILF